MSTDTHGRRAAVREHVFTTAGNDDDVSALFHKWERQDTIKSLKAKRQYLDESIARLEAEAQGTDVATPDPNNK
jgi:hypothetical protein